MIVNINDCQSRCPLNSDYQQIKGFFYTVYKSCAGHGFSGDTFHRGQHLWLNGRQALRSTVLQQTQFLKDAKIETLLCIPCKDGVLELGTVKQVQEDFNLIQSIFNFFDRKKILIAKDVCGSWFPEHLSESSIAQSCIHNEIINIPKLYETLESPNYSTLMDSDLQESNSFPLWQSRTNSFDSISQKPNTTLENDISNIYMLEDASSSLSSEILLLGTESNNVGESILTLLHENSTQHNSKILAQCQLQRPNQSLPHLSSINYGAHQVFENQSAFKKWHLNSSLSKGKSTQGHQRMLKCLQGFLRKMHATQIEEAKLDTFQISPLRRGLLKRNSSLSQKAVADNHKIAERKRRRKQSQQLSALKSLIPYALKGDKLSILQNAIAYLKHVKAKAEDLEQQSRELQSIIENKSLLIPLSQARADVEEVNPSPVTSIEEVFNAFKNQLASPSSLASICSGGCSMEIIKVGHLHERSLSIDICCRKNTSDIFIKIISSLLHMGLEVRSSFQASTLDKLYIYLTTFDKVGERDSQGLSTEVEKVLKNLISLD
ncbi:hypothetical protein O6H91_05G104400 [Diphasiastrum complanatum]|nr:hypothetical protein O6H91_05G104400 [Diphasiastrum complanatum]